MIRQCETEDFPRILTIINQGAEAYREVIPMDCWHDPYMPEAELAAGIANGIVFYGYESEGQLLGVMGLQPVREVTLIRHAYVLPDLQRQGIGSRLVAHCLARADGPVLVGTWAAADWAIRFYRKHDFRLVGEKYRDRLLRQYWSIPDRQRAVSVVLASPAWFDSTDSITQE